MKYIHIEAMVNGAIKDVLVSAELFREEGETAEDFFAGNATDIRIREVRVSADHILPDTFGE